MTNFGIFVQARLTSSRYPKKVIANLGGKTVLDHVVDNCKATGFKTFLLVPDYQKKEFDEVYEFGKKVQVYPGSENDVLERFYNCALDNKVKNIVRITGDCPFIKPKMIVHMVKEYKDKNVDFISNVAYNNYGESLTFTPSGFDIEIFSFNAIALANNLAESIDDREHVTSWMRKNLKSKHYCEKFTICLPFDGQYSVDHFYELSFMRRNFEILSNVDFKDK